MRRSSLLVLSTSPSAKSLHSDPLDLFPFGLHHRKRIDDSLNLSDRELSGTESDSSDSDADEDDSEDNEYNSSHATTQRHMELVKQLDSHITNLMDLLPTLSHSHNIKSLPPSEASKPVLDVPAEVSALARPYVIQVQDRFKLIDDRLANRLGEANWQRYLRLQKLAMIVRAQAGFEEAQDSSDDGDDNLGMVEKSFMPASEFHDSGLGSSVPASSRYAISNASHSSFLSTESAAGRGVARVPATPGEVEDGKPVRCSICGEVLENIKSRAEWK